MKRGRRKAGFGLGVRGLAERLDRDILRGRGFTTAQIINADHGALYLMPHGGFRGYAQGLALALNRRDLEFVSVSQLYCKLIGTRHALVVDHAFSLGEQSPWAREEFNRARDYAMTYRGLRFEIWPPESLPFPLR